MVVLVNPTQCKLEVMVGKGNSGKMMLISFLSLSPGVSFKLTTRTPGLDTLEGFSLSLDS